MLRSLRSLALAVGGADVMRTQVDEQLTQCRENAVLCCDGRLVFTGSPVTICRRLRYSKVRLLTRKGLIWGAA
jgi:hypothetical protein